MAKGSVGPISQPNQARARVARATQTSARINAPDSNRIAVNVAGSISPAPIAARYSSEFAANPSRAAIVNAAIFEALMDWG